MSKTTEECLNISNMTQETALHVSVTNKNPETLIKHLKFYPEEINLRDSSGNT